MIQCCFRISGFVVICALVNVALADDTEQSEQSETPSGAAAEGVDGASVATPALANADEEPAESEDEAEEEDVDVLLVETGNILVDAVAARNELLASHP